MKSCGKWGMDIDLKLELWKRRVGRTKRQALARSRRGREPCEEGAEATGRIDMPLSPLTLCFTFNVVSGLWVPCISVCQPTTTGVLVRLVIFPSREEQSTSEDLCRSCLACLIRFIRLILAMLLQVFVQMGLTLSAPPIVIADC